MQPSPILVADLRGSVAARAEQHGERFAETVRESGIIEFYRRYCEHHLFPDAGPAQKGFVRLLHALCARRLSPEARQAVAGFSRGAGFDEELIARSLVMPDVLNYLIGLGANLLRAIPSLGCTSAAAWGDYSRGGKLRYARNLDFPGNGIWDRHPLVSRHRPEHGIPYVTVGTAGSFLDGITGLNEEGLSVALHQHITTDVALFSEGRPILDLATRVLMSARTLEDAVGMARAWKPTSGWTMVLTQWRQKAAAIVELSPNAMAVRRLEEGKLVRANDFSDPRMHAGEIDYAVWRESSGRRMARVDQLLEENKGRADAALLASIVSDHYDAAHDGPRAVGQTIAQPHNMTSVVFEPEDGVLWLAEGEAPTCQGPYRKVPLWEEKPPQETLAGVEDPLPPARRQAYKRYLGAIMAWNKQREGGDALALLKESVLLDPGEPIYRYLHGLVACRRGQPEAAHESFAAGASLRDFPHRASAQRLWQARSLDLLDRRAEALSLYRGLADDQDVKPVVRRAAQRGQSRAYASGSVRQIQPDFFHFDVYRY